MAYYDSFGGFNRLTKLEIINRNVVRTIFWLSLIDLLSLSFQASREFHFETAPTALWVTASLLFLMSSLRMDQAMVYGRNPNMEASYSWRAGKDLLEAYDFMGPGPDYSFEPHNRLFFTSVALALTYLICDLLHVDWLSIFNQALDLLIAIASIITPTPEGLP
jgi:hypothetical protein